MVRLGKLTDYGLVLMTCIARDQGAPLRTARDLARESKLPLSTVSKLLKELLQSGLLVSHRGTKGGYVLARDASRISVVDIIAAIEGPMALTECSTDLSLCTIEACCPIKNRSKPRSVISAKPGRKHGMTGSMAIAWRRRACLRPLPNWSGPTAKTRLRNSSRVLSIAFATANSPPRLRGSKRNLLPGLVVC